MNTGPWLDDVRRWLLGFYAVSVTGVMLFLAPWRHYVDARIASGGQALGLSSTGDLVFAPLWRPPQALNALWSVRLETTAVLVEFLVLTVVFGVALVLVGRRS